MLAFVIMREIHRHVDAEDLEQYSMGTSSHEDSEIIEEHLLTCEGCQNRLRDTDAYVLAMRTASQQVRWRAKSVKEHGWRIPVWFPALAAACVMLLIAATLRLAPPPGPAVGVSLTALRNNGTGSRAPAGREILLQPDLTGLAEVSSYRLEIVDQTGRTVRQATYARARNGVKVPGLNAGMYFVRVYMPAGELLREYGLEIQ
jgi:hypothetical protein